MTPLACAPRAFFFISQARRGHHVAVAGDARSRPAGAGAASVGARVDSHGSSAASYRGQWHSTPRWRSRPCVGLAAPRHTRGQLEMGRDRRLLHIHSFRRLYWTGQSRRSV
ncbi:hypothetical protein B566_EDAN013743, partial [Ephemera danica]